MIILPFPVSLELHEFLKKNKKDGESFDKCIVRLLKNYPVSNWDEGYRKGITLSPETVEFIKEYRLTKGESIENILIRLFLYEKKS